MALALSLTLAQGACVATAPAVSPVGQPVRVANGGQPWQMWEGAAARKAADAKCGPRGVRSTIYDRYDRSYGRMGLPGWLRMTHDILSNHERMSRAACHGISTGIGPTSLARAAKEAMMRPFITLMTLATLAVATPALALVPINEEPKIINTLLARVHR